MANFTPPKAAKLVNPKSITIAAVIIGALIFLATSVYIVDQSEVAVVTRFGKYLTTTKPGLRFKLPFGIDKTYIVNVLNVHTEEFGFRSSTTLAFDPNISTMLTGDLNMMNVTWNIQYRITEPIDWTFNVLSRTNTIRDVSQSVINMLVGDRAIMDIIGFERSVIEDEGATLMNATFNDYGLGINVIAVKLQNTSPPAGRVQEAFDDVNMAIQDRNRLINEGQRAYNEVIPRTRGEADRIIQVAEGYAADRRNRAIGEVARFSAVYEEYRLAPDVTRQRLYYEMVEDVFMNDNSTLIDRQFNNFLPFRDIGNNSLQGGR